MNTFKKILGILWFTLAIASAYFCIFVFGLPKFTTGKSEDIVFGSIIVFILAPLIVFGLTLFGYYSITGEYDNHTKK